MSKLAHSDEHSMAIIGLMAAVRDGEYLPCAYCEMEMPASQLCFNPFEREKNLICEECLEQERDHNSQHGLGA